MRVGSTKRMCQLLASYGEVERQIVSALSCPQASLKAVTGGYV